MADVQQTYKFKFEFDRKDVKKQLKEISVDVKDAIAQIGDASDKVVIFKELVSYLSNVDKALDAFKTKHKDDFSNLFGNPDKEILGVLTEIFNTTQQSAMAFATLKDKISAAESGKAELSTLRSIAEEINTLFVSIGQTPKINIDEMFSGKGSKAKGTDFAGRIKLLNDTLSEFGITYSGFQNKLKGGFSFGGTGGPSISKEMQKEIDALNKQKSELQEIIDAIDGKDIKINISVKDDTKQIKNLLEEYKKIDSKIISNEFKDLSLNEQNKLLAEQLRLATLLKNARDHINKKGGSDEAFDLVNAGEGLRIIDNIEKSLDGHRLEIQKKADQIKNIYADLIANIDVKLNQLSIDNLNIEPTRQSITSAIELMQEANRIIGEISYDSQNYDLLDAQLDSIIDKIKQLAVSEEQVEQLDELLDINRDAPEDVLDELCTILEVDIPRAAEKARDAIDGIAGGQNGPSKQNISILAKQLQEIYNISRQIGDNEIGFAVDIDGSAYFVQSADHIVKVADEASVAVRALNENLTILGHTHPSGGGLFSAGDYRSAISQKRSGMNMPVVAVGSNAASLLNLDGVDETTLDQIERVLDRFKDSDDAVGPSVVKELQNILSANGFTDALQVVDISNGMDDLSEALLKLSLNATEVQTPLQKLQSLIQYYSGNKLDADGISRFANEWKSFESGAKSAAEVFDSVMYKLDATDLEGNYFRTSEKEYENLSTSLNMIKPSADTAINAISEVENKLKSFFEFADKMQHENLYGSAENNVDIGRYIERLEKAKTELEELGKQGIITAEDLEKVNTAFTEAVIHLEAETSHYDSYYSGPSYDYYDDYKQEQSKNGDLENELTRKDERIAELESDLRSSDDALQETLGNKYALIAESRTLEIERAKLLLQKQNLEYEDILALMQSYQNLQAKAKEAFDYGDEKAMYNMQEIAGQIYDRVVPQNLDDFTEPDRWFKAIGVSAEEGAQKLLEFRERLDSIRSSHDDLELSDSEDIGDLQRENGALQDKLDLLNEIASVYGSNITQKDRKHYEELTDKEMESGLTSKEEDRLSDLSDKVYEADSALEELGNTYDKIILKLANGKKVEILPDDAGLRALNKFSNEGYGETYNGYDIDDVVFVRKQEQSVIEQTSQELQEQLNLQKQINDESNNISRENSELEKQNVILDEKSRILQKIKDYFGREVTKDVLKEVQTNGIKDVIYDFGQIMDDNGYPREDLFSMDEIQDILFPMAWDFKDKVLALEEKLGFIGDPDVDERRIAEYFDRRLSDGWDRTDIGKIFDEWFEREGLGARDKLGSLLDGDDRLKHPALISMYHRYTHRNKSDISYDEFLNTPIEMYRVPQRENEQDVNDYLSLSLSSEVVKKFGENVQRYLIKPIDTLGSPNTYKYAEEDEVIAPSATLGPDYQFDASRDLAKIQVMRAYQESVRDAAQHAQDSVSDVANSMKMFESADGQFKLFDDIIEDANTAEDVVENLNNEIKESSMLDGQIGFDDYIASKSVDNGDQTIKDSSDVSTSSEIAQLEALQQKLLEVKAAVDAKTQAFEQEYVTVDGVVEAEIAALQELSNKLDGIITNVGLVEASLKNIGSNSIQLNVSDSEEQLASLLTSSDITREMTELDRLQKQIIGVKNAVLSKTKAFVDEGNVVGQVVGKEISGLIKLEGIVNNISKKISELVQNITALNQRGINFNQNTDVLDVTTRTPEEQFKIDKTAQKGALTKYLNSLKDVDYVVGDLRKKLNDLPELLDIAATPDNLNKFKEIFAEIKKEVENARRGFEEREGRGISSRKNALYTSFNALNVEQQKKLKEDFDVAINKLQEYEAQIKAGKRVELDALEAAIKGIREKIEAQAELNKAAKDAEKTQKKNAKFGDTAMVNAQSKYNSLNQIVHSDQFNKSSLVMKSWEDYEKSYKHLQETRDRLAKKESITGDDEAEFRAAKEACNEYAKSLNKILNNSIKLSTEKANKNPYTLGADFDYDNIESRKAALADFVKAEYDVVLGTENFKKGFKEAMFEVDNGDGTMTKMTAKFTEARNEIVAMAGDAKKVKGAFSGFIDGVLTRIKSLSQFFIATISVYDVWNVIKKGIGYVKEIDGALTELKKVTDGTDASYNQFLQDMSKTASVTGSTVKDLTSSAAD